MADTVPHRWDAQAASTLLGAFLHKINDDDTIMARASSLTDTSSPPLPTSDKSAKSPVSLRDTTTAYQETLSRDTTTAYQGTPLTSGLLRRLSRVICSTSTLTAAQIGGIAAAMAQAGVDMGSDPVLYAHLSACARAIPASAYTWRSMSCLAQAMSEAGALREDLRNHTQVVMQSLPAASADALSVSVALNALARAGSLSSNVISTVERLSILPYTPREAALMLCALARAGARAAASPLALRMMTIAVRGTPGGYDRETVCKAARAYTLLGDVPGGNGGGGAGRRAALMRTVIGSSRAVDWSGVPVGDGLHMLYALGAQAGAEETVVKLMDALKRTSNGVWTARDAARGINTLTKPAFAQDKEAITAQDMKAVSTLLEKFGSIILERAICAEDTPSVAQAAGHFPRDSPLQKPLMLAAIRAVKTACEERALTPAELAIMANGITLENGAKDSGETRPHIVACVYVRA
jgi:hypothetical protein